MPNRPEYDAAIRRVENYPTEGIRFYDIMPLIGNAGLWASMVQEMAAPHVGQIDKVVGFDARGFLFAGALASLLEAGVVALRKPGKLPGPLLTRTYDLEYGQSALSLQEGAIQPGERVLLVDDVVATGGTALAGIELAREAGADIREFCTAIDLPGLGGSERIRAADVPVRSLVEF